MFPNIKTRIEKWPSYTLYVWNIKYCGNISVIYSPRNTEWRMTNFLVKTCHLHPLLWLLPNLSNCKLKKDVYYNLLPLHIWLFRGLGVEVLHHWFKGQGVGKHENYRKQSSRAKQTELRNQRHVSFIKSDIFDNTCMNPHKRQQF